MEKIIKELNLDTSLLDVDINEVDKFELIEKLQAQMEIILNNTELDGIYEVWTLFHNKQMEVIKNA